MTSTVYEQLILNPTYIPGLVGHWPCNDPPFGTGSGKIANIAPTGHGLDLTCMGTVNTTFAQGGKPVMPSDAGRIVSDGAMTTGGAHPDYFSSSQTTFNSADIGMSITLLNDPGYTLLAKNTYIKAIISAGVVQLNNNASGTFTNQNAQISSATSFWVNATVGGFAQGSDNALMDFATNALLLMGWVNWTDLNVALGSVLSKRNQWALSLTLQGRYYGWQATVYTKVSGHPRVEHTYFTQTPGAVIGQPFFIALGYNDPYLQIFINGIDFAQHVVNGNLNIDTFPLGLGAGGSGGLANFGGWIQHVSMIKSLPTFGFAPTLQELYYRGMTGFGNANWGSSSGVPIGVTSGLVFPWSEPLVAANAARKKITIINGSEQWIYLARANNAIVSSHSPSGRSLPPAGYAYTINLPPHGGRFVDESGFAGAFSAMHYGSFGALPVSIQEEY